MTVRKAQLQQRHAHEQAVARLAKVSGPRIAVHVGGDLYNQRRWQRRQPSRWPRGCFGS